MVLSGTTHDQRNTNNRKQNPSLLEFCVKCALFFVIRRDWKGGLLVLCENGAKMAILAGFSYFWSVFFNWPL